jgi:phosphoglucomutase
MLAFLPYVHTLRRACAIASYHIPTSSLVLIFSFHSFRCSIDVVPVTAFAGQTMGTSGLRKKVTEVKQPGYLESFVQSIFNTLIEGVRVERKAAAVAGNELNGITLVVSGDGRYFNRHAVATIIRMARANGVSKILVGVDYLMSTPAVSAVVRQHKAFGAIILTASHNPGGPDGDFGIKYNMGNGGPAPEGVTKQIENAAKAITSYKIGREELVINPSTIGTTTYGSLTVEVIDAAEEYAALMAVWFVFTPFMAVLRLLVARDIDHLRF